MNVLFIRPAAPFIHPSSFNEKSIPLGIGFLAAAVKKEGMTPLLIDRYINPSLDVSAEFLLKKSIDVVCLSLDSITIFDGLLILKRLDYYRKRGIWTGKIICGGPHISYFPEDVSEICDSAVVGEGDYSIIDAINTRKRLIRSPRIKNLDELPFPDYDLLLQNDYNANFVSNYAVNISTSRGCPYSCNYCSSNGIWGHLYAYYSAERVFEEMLLLHKNYGYTHFTFREDNFIVNKKRVEILCNLILNQDISFTWDCEARADALLDYGLALLMKSAGLRTVFVGMESASDEVLAAYDKRIKLSTIVACLEVCREAGIDVFGSFIAGTPFDTPVTMKQTLDFAVQNLQNYKINAFIGLPKSRLYDYCLQNGIYDYYDPETRTFYCQNYNLIMDKYVLNQGEKLFPWRASPSHYVENEQNINMALLGKSSENTPVPTSSILINRNNYLQLWSVLAATSTIDCIYLDNCIHLYTQNEFNHFLNEAANKELSRILIITRLTTINDLDDSNKAQLFLKNYPCRFLLSKDFLDQHTDNWRQEYRPCSNGFTEISLWRNEILNKETG